MSHIEIDPATGKRIVYVKEKFPLLKMAIMIFGTGLVISLVFFIMGFVAGSTGASKPFLDPVFIDDTLAGMQGKPLTEYPDELTKKN